MERRGVWSEPRLHTSSPHTTQENKSIKFLPKSSTPTPTLFHRYIKKIQITVIINRKDDFRKTMPTVNHRLKKNVLRDDVKPMSFGGRGVLRVVVEEVGACTVVRDETCYVRNRWWNFEGEMKKGSSWRM